MSVCQIVCVSFFPFGIEGGIWDVIVLIPDHCLSIYFGIIVSVLIKMVSIFFCCFISRNNIVLEAE